jgi:hypothetical protein
MPACRSLQIKGKNPEVLRIDLPRGLSYLELSVKAKDSDPNIAASFAGLDEVEITGIDLKLGK